jgi:hypothetical protein
MPDENPTRVDAGELWMAQRAIILQLLRDDHPERWTRPELEAKIDDIEQQALVSALAILALEGVAVFDDEAIWASPCARHLDSLELVSI